MKRVDAKPIDVDQQSDITVITPSAAEYTEEQFVADLKKARKPLEAMAERARKSMKEGTARKFPE